MKSPAFQFYAADFLVGIMGFSDEEVGVYIKMLSFQWLKGGLPNSPKGVRIAINSRKNPSENVMKKFTVSADGLLRNERLEKEREKQEKFRESRADNARAGWSKRSTSNARADSSICIDPCIKDALQSSSSSSDKTPVVPKGTRKKSDPFERVKENTPTMVLIGKWFNRKPTNLWTKDDADKLARLDPDPDDIADLDFWYSHTRAEVAAVTGHDPRQTALATLLNNWEVACDRARAFKADSRQLL